MHDWMSECFASVLTPHIYCTVLNTRVSMFRVILGPLIVSDRAQWNVRPSLVLAVLHLVLD